MVTGDEFAANFHRAAVDDGFRIDVFRPEKDLEMPEAGSVHDVDERVFLLKADPADPSFGRREESVLVDGGCEELFDGKVVEGIRRLIGGKSVCLDESSSLKRPILNSYGSSKDLTKYDHPQFFIKGDIK